METNENIAKAFALLEQVSLDEAQQPAIIRLAPDSDAYVIGNRSGYVHLAISSLRAAQGSDQSFKNVAWVDTEELDWGLQGLRYDEYAHTYLRTPQTRWGKLFSAILPIALAVCFLVGLGTIGYGLFHLFSN